MDNNGETPISCKICNANANQDASIPNGPSGWWGELGTVGFNWGEYCDKVNGKYVFTNACVDNMMNGYSYRMSRVAVTQQWDELNFAMGLYLGFDTIQMTMSANGGGFWQFEIMELRGYPEKAKTRNYSDFIRLQAGQTCPGGSLEYIPSFTKNYMSYISRFLSVRDPLDITNESKARKCTIPIWKSGVINMTCQENVSKIFTDISVFTVPNALCACNYDTCS